MDKYPNLYGDLSEPGGYWAIHRDRRSAASSSSAGPTGSSSAPTS